MLVDPSTVLTKLAGEPYHRNNEVFHPFSSGVENQILESLKNGEYEKVFAKSDYVENVLAKKSGEQPVFTSLPKFNKFLTSEFSYHAK